MKRFAPLFFMLLLVSVDAHAATSASDIAKNLLIAIEASRKLMFAGVVVCGVFVFIFGLLRLRKYAENPIQYSIPSSLLILFVGSYMISFVSAIHITDATLFGKDALSSLSLINVDTGNLGQYNLEWSKVTFALISLVGFWAIAKTLWILYQLGKTGDAQYTVPKAAVHAFSGVLAIHLASILHGIQYFLT